MAAIVKVVENMVVDLGSLLDGGDGAVVNLVAGETQLAAHRALLEARSPTLAVMLDSGSCHVRVPGVEGDVLRQLLCYLYTLQAPQLPGVAARLLPAADRFGVSGLKAHCERQLVAELDVENAATAAVLALKHSCPGLTAAAVDFIRANPQVMATRGWVEAVRTQPDHVVEVSRLLVDPPADAGTPATESRRPTPDTLQQPDVDNGHQPPTAATPTTAASHTAALAANAVSHVGTPATESRRPTPDTLQQPDVDNGHQPPTAATPTTAASHTAALAANAVSHVGAPATESRSPSPDTLQQPDVDNVHQPPTGAAPSTDASPTPALAANDISHLGRLSGDERGRKLIQAAMVGEVEDMRALIALGVDVYTYDGAGRTAMHWAASEGHVEAVRCLVEEGGMPVNTTTCKWKETPLHVAVLSGQIPVVRYLLAAGATCLGNNFGKTPLHWAAWCGNAEVVAALLEKGADRKLKDHSWRTPLDYARKNNQQQIIELLTPR